ncbi:MAG: fluoride efflux transporter CrcB [Dinghuibacter sp.]|nr:fluoride efflux transporter CrcB [Dinghuibacter sp.]
MYHYLLVALGGATGAACRYGLSQLTWGRNFPYATFFINIAGSLLIGILFAVQQQGRLSEKYWLLLATGLCGGFTTFSAFSLENLALLQQQKMGLFLLYAAGSVLACLGAVYLGYRAVHHS